MLMPASTASRSIAASSSSVKLAWPPAARFSSSCGDAAGADEHGGHPLVAQRPGQRELGQGLAPRGGDLSQRADVKQGPFGNLVGRKRLVQRPPGTPVGTPRPGTCRSSTPWASGEKAMQPTPSRPSTLEQPALDPPVQHRVGRLVDEQRRAHPPEQGDRVQVRSAE